MASRASTPSEGEIIESDSEKATTSLPSVVGISVDRQSRKRVSVSRSPSPTRSSTRYKSRTRSRSPYREARGTKRSREASHNLYEDRADPRRFKVHYEERLKEDLSRDRSHYHNISRRGGQDPGSRYRDNNQRRGSREKRSRTRSGSPNRKSNKKSQSDQSEHPRGASRQSGYIGRDRGDHGYKESNGRLSREQSVSDRGHPSVATASRKQEAELRNNQTQRSVPSRSNLIHEADNTKLDNPLTSNRLDVPIHVSPMNEAAMIEARRKKREAIKAKYKDQGTPMIVKALALNNDISPPSPVYKVSIHSPQDSGSPNPSPPRTPKDVSGQDSPNAFDIVKDEDLANDSVRQPEETQEDEPSAADYDPTMDMQEDKLRHDQRVYGNDVSSGVYDETKSQKKDVLIPNTVADTHVSKKLKDEFDMFADEDEDDMFAEASISKEDDEDEIVGKALTIPLAKALDMSMLDDWDDEEGYYKVILGELLDGRYHVQSNLGKGMFSGVVRAMDHANKRLVAIKLIRSNETMKKAGLKEIEILQKLTLADPEDKKHMIRLERHFEHKGHLCMVFENLSINLREVLKKFGRDVGINLKAVRAYAQQMFLGLSLLRKCNILHADLKPDNVLVNESRNMLKICDLGSASDALENEITPYLVSRFYRAPEIMLGMSYDFAIDIWSIGCTLFELYTGKILFTGRNNNQMLRSIMECRGKFNHKILRKAQFAGLHFDDLLNFRSVEKDRLSGKDVVRILPFTKPTRDLRTRLGANARGMGDAESKELNLFVDLLDRCLNLNPEKRCTASEALKHPFIMRKG